MGPLEVDEANAGAHSAFELFAVATPPRAYDGLHLAGFDDQHKIPPR
jgi:hypothetical protein